jgi:hypothetical protein
MIYSEMLVTGCWMKKLDAGYWISRIKYPVSCFFFLSSIKYLVSSIKPLNKEGIELACQLEPEEVQVHDEVVEREDATGYDDDDRCRNHHPSDPSKPHVPGRLDLGDGGKDWEGRGQ